MTLQEIEKRVAEARGFEISYSPNDWFKVSDVLSWPEPSEKYQPDAGDKFDVIDLAIVDLLLSELKKLDKYRRDQITNLEQKLKLVNEKLKAKGEK
jgi:hypothetical protein